MQRGLGGVKLQRGLSHAPLYRMFVLYPHICPQVEAGMEGRVEGGMEGRAEARVEGRFEAGVEDEEDTEEECCGSLYSEDEALGEDLVVTTPATPGCNPLHFPFPLQGLGRRPHSSMGLQAEHADLSLPPKSPVPGRVAGRGRQRTFSTSATVSTEREPIIRASRRTIYTAGRPPWYDSQGQQVGYTCHLTCHLPPGASPATWSLTCHLTCHLPPGASPVTCHLFQFYHSFIISLIHYESI